MVGADYVLGRRFDCQSDFNLSRGTENELRTRDSVVALISFLYVLFLMSL